MHTIILGLWQFLFVWAVGFAITKNRFSSLSYGYRTALAFALGELVLSYIYYGIALAGGLRFWVLIPPMIVGSLLLAPLLRSELKTVILKSIPHIRRNILASVVISLLFLIYFLGACVPEREVDSVWYHIGVPLYYITHGGAMQLVPYNMPAHYPMNVHLHYVTSLLIGNDSTCKIFILCHSIPFLILLWSVVKRYTHASWGLFAVAIYLCCIHFRLPVMANVQRAVFFHVFLSSVLLWKSFEQNNRKLFLLSAVICGMAMGTKFNALLFGLIPQWLFIAYRGMIQHRYFIKKTVHQLILYPIIALMMMSPWMIKSFIYTGNPLYPLLGNFFNTHPDFVYPMKSNATSHGINILKSNSLSEFFAMMKENFDYLLYNSDLLFFLGVAAAIALPLIALKKKRYLNVGVFTAISFLLFTQLWGTDIARLFAIVYGVSVVCITITLSLICKQISHPKLFRNFLIVSLFLTFLHLRYAFLQSPTIQWYGGIALTENARREWLIQRDIVQRDVFDMMDWMDENVPQEDEIYVMRSGYPLFFKHRKYFVSGGRFEEQMYFWLEKGADHAWKNLSQHNPKWLLHTAISLEAMPTEIRREWKRFKEDYLELVRKEDGVFLYRVNRLKPNA